MSTARIFKPKQDQIVYHYCSANTLKAILESRKFRFSDINMMNDAKEYIHGYEIFEEAATRFLNRTGIGPNVPVIEKEFFDAFDKVLGQIQLIAHPFISCYSEEKDSLGQWRAYGDDGKGFAIGIRADCLDLMPVRTLKVEYNEEKQVLEMMAEMLAMYERYTANGKADDQAFFEDRVLAATFSVGFKNPAFAYENEVRSLHVVGISKDEPPRFVDHGGTNSKGQEFSPFEISYQVSENHLRAFVDIPFWNQDEPCPISEIVIGPKNQSSPSSILLYLGSLGYKDVQLTKSIIPYR